MKDLIIIGAGGHGKVVADIAQKMGVYKTISFLDDGNVKTAMGLPVLGTVNEVQKYIDCADVFVAIGNNTVRRELLEKLFTMGASIPVLIHPNAVIGERVVLGCGTVVMAGAVINPCSNIGIGSIINTCASVDHDCEIGNYTHISVGVHLAGAVSVGEQTFLGIGAIVKNNVSICENNLIGAGAVVVKDITEAGTYIGVPAKRI